MYGKEFGFGGHPYDSSGCFAIDPKNASSVMGPGVSTQPVIIVVVIGSNAFLSSNANGPAFALPLPLPQVVLRRSIYVGTTQLSRRQVQQLVDAMGLIYPCVGGPVAAVVGC